MDFCMDFLLSYSGAQQLIQWKRCIGDWLHLSGRCCSKATCPLTAANTGSGSTFKVLLDSQTRRPPSSTDCTKSLPSCMHATLPMHFNVHAHAVLPLRISRESLSVWTLVQSMSKGRNPCLLRDGILCVLHIPA